MPTYNVKKKTNYMNTCVIIFQMFADQLPKSKQIVQESCFLSNALVSIIIKDMYHLLSTYVWSTERNINFVSILNNQNDFQGIEDI